jgi:hypothetical protein
MTNKFKSIARSFIIVPMLATGLSMNVFTSSIQSAVVASKDTVIVLSAEELALQKLRTETAAKIDAYFAKYQLPLAGHGMTFVTEAEKSGLPLTLLAAIGMAESTGCKFIIPGTYNCFGWGSGRIKFASIDDAIAQISANLGGHDEDTDHYYAGKTVLQILHTYNPPKVAPGYDAKVLRIMKQIESMPL